MTDKRDYSFSSRARSIYGDEPASEFLEWLERVLSKLTPEERATATMEARPSMTKMVMVGIRWKATKGASLK